MKIFKYTLDNFVFNEIKMPMEAKILSANVQQGEIQVWALVDDIGVELEVRNFSVFGTGWPINIKERNLEFIQTVFVGELVWHVFEIK